MPRRRTRSRHSPPRGARRHHRTPSSKRHPITTPEQARRAAYGPWEFQSEKWELAYIKRIDATIAALKSAGVPVIWVGLASQRGTKASEVILSQRALPQADREGGHRLRRHLGWLRRQIGPLLAARSGIRQIRRLRTGDGVYFTKFGARKLAHYVEREIQRIVGNKGMPVALPTPIDPTSAGAESQAGRAGRAAGCRTGRAAHGHAHRAKNCRRRPGAPAAPTDATITRALTKGEPVTAPSGEPTTSAARGAAQTRARCSRAGGG